MNRVRNQLLAAACFSLDQHCRTCRRDPFDLFEHRFQSRTVAFDLLDLRQEAIEFTQCRNARLVLLTAHTNQFHRILAEFEQSGSFLTVQQRLEEGVMSSLSSGRLTV